MAGSFKYRYSLRGQYDITFPSGAKRTYAYDDQGRLTSLGNLEPGGTTRGTYAYGYDLNHATGQSTMMGQRVSMTATVPTPGLSNSLFKYEYDAGHQLTKATCPNVSPFNGEVDQWSYDGIGNRLTSTVNSTTRTYAYQKIGGNPLNWQRLTSDGASAYTYDASGNSLTRGATGFTWNADDRLTGITGTPSYSYDIQGRRGSKTVGAATSTYLYDGLNLVREAGAAPADYLYGPGIDEPLAMVRGGATYYYGVDGLGSVTLVMNAVGVVQNKYLYDAWGQTRSQTTPVGNPFGYTGREIGETSTLFYRARYYQPSIGRFLSEDPIGFRGGPNLYAYVGGDPVQYSDPWGLVAQFCCRPVKPTKYRHCYIRTDNGTTYSLFPDGGRGVPSRNDPRDAPGKGENCKDCPPKRCPNFGSNQTECLDQASNAYPVGEYRAFGPNSNTYAASMANSCCDGGMPRGMGNTPGSDSPLPTPSPAQPAWPN